MTTLSVWITSYGVWDNWVITGIWTTKEAAERHAKWWSKNQGIRIEEYKLDTCLEMPPPNSQGNLFIPNEE